MIGIINRQTGKYDTALDNFFHPLKLYEQIDNKTGICFSFSLIGFTYYKVLKRRIKIKGRKAGGYFEIF